MTATVTELRRQPVPGVVELCERLLEAARSGHLRDLAVATVVVDRSVGTAWSYDPDDPDLFRLLGAVGLLEHRILFQEVERG